MNKSHIHTEEELRSEFYLKIADFTDENHHDIEPYQMQKIADWWLSKMKEREEKLLDNKKI